MSKRVLIVEDDKEISSILQTFLEQKGYEVWSALDGHVATQEIALTAKEMHLLRLFLENPEKVFTKANLYEAVWNDVYYYEDNTINVHISNLRNKLKKATGQDFVERVWGIGYRLKES